MKHLLTTEELRKLGRPIGKVADDKLTAFITEAEQLHIKPILGDELFIGLLAEQDKAVEQRDEVKTMLLDGGSYVINEGCDG